MATYKGIQGYTVQKLASDPTASEAVGQLWYNSGSGAFKIGTEGAGAWTATPAINTARRYQCGAGSSTAGLIYNGGPNSPAGVSLLVESWDGSSWTETNNTSNANNVRGRAGTSTTAMGVAGSPVSTNATELYNGSS